MKIVNAWLCTASNLVDTFDHVCSCTQGYESKDNNTFNCTGTKSLIKFLSQIRVDGNPSPDSKCLER